MEPDTVTADEAARSMRMSRIHLHMLLDDGTLPSHRVGRERLIRLRDLAPFIEKRDIEHRELAERFAARRRIEDDAARELSELP